MYVLATPKIEQIEQYQGSCFIPRFRMSLEELDTKALYAQPPPKFGHDLLKHFAIDAEYVNLNHGTFHSPQNSSKVIITIR